MLKLIKDLPAHVVGVEATNEVTADDLKNVLIPALDENVKQYGKINYLLILHTDVQNWSAGAWLQDMWAGLKNFTAWNRIAVVTDQEMVEKFTDGFSLVTPGEAKGFKLSEEQEARSWISQLF
ncbi:STAS/SEC14 domain-containing protein [Pelobium manganitolerans]|uniref:STAS/SEC14 domain-containing protein n=1 Tax=Pelobium manganitolerans TaxID=1842495 RepID=UPI003FA38BE5